MSEFAAPPSPTPVSPTLDMSTISEAYEILKRRLKPLATVSALFFVVLVILMGSMMAIWFGTFMAVFNGGEQNIVAMMFALYLNPFFWAAIIIGNIIPIMMQVAISAMTFKELRGEEPTFADGINAVKENVGQILVFALMLCGIYLVLAFICSIVSIFAQAAFFIAVPAMVDQKLKPVDALKYSYEKVKSQYWMVFGIYLLSTIISGLGGIACYVGYIFTAPFLGITPTLVYWKLRAAEGVVFHSGSPYPRGGEGYGAPMPTTAPMIAETPRPESMYTEPTPAVPPMAEPAAPPISDAPSAPPMPDPAPESPVGDSTMSWPSEMPPSDPTPPSDFPSTSEDPPRSE